MSDVVLLIIMRSIKNTTIIYKMCRTLLSFYQVKTACVLQVSSCLMSDPVLLFACGVRYQQEVIRLLQVAVNTEQKWISGGERLKIKASQL